MSTAPTDPSAQGPRLNGIGVVVSDMTAAIAFYARLGLSFPEGAAAEPHVSVELGPGVQLMLDTEALIRSIYPDWTGAGQGRVALAVQLPTPAEVDRLYAEIAADGLGHRKPWDAEWGQRYASVTDPDGTSIDLYAQQGAPQMG